MAITKIRPNQAKTLETFDDQKAPGVGLESTALTLEGFLQGVISQVNRLIHTTTTGEDWHDDLTAPVTFEGGVKRGLDILNQNLHDLERRRLLCLQYNFESINVPNGQNYVLLNVAARLPETLTAAVGDVTTLGTVVAAHTGTFGTHSLDVVTGFNNLNPKNIVAIVDATTRDPLLSSGRQIYGLLQSENATDGHTILANTPNLTQISFVRLNAVGGALEACPVADIELQDIHYAAVKRIPFQTFDEQLLLPGALYDATAGGSGGGGSVEQRAESVTSGLISANTLIIGSGGGANTDADLLDYEDVDFVSQVKIYINGRIMRNGANAGTNFDVYPSAIAAEQNVGAFYCEFDLQPGDTIQMFVGDATVGGGGGGGTWGSITGTLSAQLDLNTALTERVLTAGTGEQDAALFTERADHVNAPVAGKAEHWVKNTTPASPMFTDDAGNDLRLAPQYATLHYGGVFNASLGTTVWVGESLQTIWLSGTKSTTFGTASTPSEVPYHVGFVVPFDGIVRRVECWYRVNNAALEGELNLHRHRWTSGTSTVATASVTSCAVASGGATSEAYDASTDPDVAVQQGDQLAIYYRSAGTPSGGMLCYYRMVVTIERTA